jgi:DNA topoisomerase IA
MTEPRQPLTLLERRIIKAEKMGEEWVAKLEESKKNVLADLENTLDDGDTSEAKLERLARGRPEWKEFIRNLVVAEAEMLKAKVRYESAVAFFEAGRTAESTERAKMRALNYVP